MSNIERSWVQMNLKSVKHHAPIQQKCRENVKLIS